MTVMSFVIQVQITRKAAGSKEKGKIGSKSPPKDEPPRKKKKPNKTRNS